MVCEYTNKTKHKCQKIVGGISLFLGLLGLITLAFGAMASGGDTMLPDSLKKIMKENKIDL
jgi:hypothetical protein